MAKIEFSAGIDGVLGAFDSKHELIVRRKHLRTPEGQLTRECASETYYQVRKRNYTNNPPKGAELAHLQHFGEAAKRTTALMKAFKNPDSATPEEREKVAQYKQRFMAQLEGESDPQAPLGKDGKPRKYYRFDNFVRAMIYQELKN